MIFWSNLPTRIARIKGKKFGPVPAQCCWKWTRKNVAVAQATRADVATAASAIPISIIFTYYDTYFFLSMTLSDALYIAFSPIS